MKWLSQLVEVFAPVSAEKKAEIMAMLEVAPPRRAPRRRKQKRFVVDTPVVANRVGGLPPILPPTQEVREDN